MRATTALLILTALPTLHAAGCGEAVPEAEASPPSRQDLPASCEGLCGAGPLYLVDRLAIAGAVDGHTEGFDLDARDGDCGVPDFLSHDGAPSIDNRFSTVFDVLPPVLRDALPTVLEETVNTGGLNLLFEVVGAEGLDETGPVGLVAHHAAGIPEVDVWGHLLPNQTVDLTGELPLGRSTDATWIDGTLLTEPFDLTLRLAFLNRAADVRLLRARLQLRPSPDGTRIDGLLAGLVPVEDAVVLGAQVGGPTDLTIRALMEEAIPLLVDARRDPGGDCDALSATFSIGAVPVYVFDPP